MAAKPLTRPRIRRDDEPITEAELRRMARSFKELQSGDYYTLDASEAEVVGSHTEKRSPRHKALS